ncbi:MAG: TonB-dependent receptor [Myxococcales bacterium]|nr:TonB-dependent receptor [Myxococcales bacterium]
MKRPAKMSPTFPAVWLTAACVLCTSSALAQPEVTAPATATRATAAVPAPAAVTPTTAPPAPAAANKRREKRFKTRRKTRRKRRRRRRHETGAVRVLGRRAKRAKVPGSAHLVGEKQLSRYEHDDIHRDLAEVPGVYVREEDGYGLRPNIGMRGAAAERSAKVTLMEDGVLIAPGPYAAPAAYYFPLVTRMTGLEVVKGPAAIRFGPSTVGGALNLVSAPIPNKRTLLVDLAAGNTMYGKAHLAYGDRTKHVGWWLEGVGLRSDGFKELDGGGPTGFTKWEGVAKLSLNTDETRKVSHALHLRFDASNEESSETYTGLSDADFKANPWRRYLGTKDDLLTWNRQSARAHYALRLGQDTRVNVTAYRHQFERTWTKLARFAAGKDIDEVLHKPTAGSNAVLYGVLTGAADSTDVSEGLVLGTNARTYLSQGVQAEVDQKLTTGQVGDNPVTHEITAGVRLHSDTVGRKATESVRLMTSGELTKSQTPDKTARDATAEALALAVWAQDTVTLGRLRLSAGVRMEHVRTGWTDHQEDDAESNGSFTAVIPGFAALYSPMKGLGLLAGVHKGFSPVSPGQPEGTKPEESLNFEAGARYHGKRVRAEVIGFFNNYSNLKGTCTFSSGCGVGAVGQEFNGGQVWIYGAEATAGVLWGGRKALKVPVSLTYTLTQSEFQAGFESSNPQWGKVSVGDALPYVPVHQLALHTGVRGKRWELALSGRYASAMRNTAGQGPETDDDRHTDATLIFDAAAHVRIGKVGKLYLTAKNLADSAQVVSYRPFGARPGMRRLVMVGFKKRF